jgi:hypothetical protein
VLIREKERKKERKEERKKLYALIILRGVMRPSRVS